MSRVDELLAKYSPKGVQYFRIGDIAVVGTGSSDRKDATMGGVYPFYVRSKDVMRKDTFEFDEEAVLIPGEGGIGEIFHYVNGKYALHQRAYRIAFSSRMVDAKFAYWYFTAHFKKFILSKAVSATVTSIRKPMITDFRIPVPPLAIQHEIVETLDKMEGLNAKLKAKLKVELDYRSSQRAVYCQTMLDRVGANRVPLGALGKWQGGVTPSKSNRAYWDAGTIPWMASMDVSNTSSDEIRGRVTPVALKETSLRLVPAPSVAVVMRSNILRRVLPVGLVKVGTTANQDLRLLIPRVGVDAEYVYQALRVDSERIRSACVRTDGSMAAVDSQNFFAWEVPLPSLDVQRRVAQKFRQLDALVNDLSGALPAEVEARRKQYDHYRDQILTFVEASA